MGLTLDEIPNDITAVTPASFEPALDYVVVKVPRFDFAKFPMTGSRPRPRRCKAWVRSWAIGRTFPEALQKAMRSLETGRRAGSLAGKGRHGGGTHRRLPRRNPGPACFRVATALAAGATVSALSDTTGIDPWFVDQIGTVVEAYAELAETGPTPIAIRNAKRLGFSDPQLAQLWDLDEAKVRSARIHAGVDTTYKR